MRKIYYEGPANSRMLPMADGSELKVPRGEVVSVSNADAARISNLSSITIIDEPEQELPLEGDD